MRKGRSRPRQAILEVYDEMAEAMKAGKPYQTRLDPPPGPPVDAEGNFLPLPEWRPSGPRPADWPRHRTTERLARAMDWPVAFSHQTTANQEYSFMDDLQASAAVWPGTIVGASLVG